MELTLFKNEEHEAEYRALTEEVSELTPAQKAFLYLIALYQNDYEKYEGCKFYVEEYEEVSIDGPVYLLENQVDLTKYPHEQMLAIAKCFLTHEEIAVGHIEDNQLFVEESMKIAGLTTNRVDD